MSIQWVRLDLGHVQCPYVQPRGVAVVENRQREQRYYDAREWCRLRRTKTNYSLTYDLPVREVK